MPPIYEVETLTGLTDLAHSELAHRFERQIQFSPAQDVNALRFAFVGQAAELLTLRLAQAVYRLRFFEVPRPKALLGHQHFQILLKDIASVQNLHPAKTFKTLHISAAGSDSSVFQRLRQAIERETGLKDQPDGGDLLLRVRPMRRHQNKLQGWEVLTRLSPRPLATRPWRVADMPGALNATIAAAMVDLSQPSPSDRFLNLMCGSGTLLIERGLAGPAQSLMGLDHNLAALQAAQRNVEAAGLSSHIQLRQAEVNAPTLPPGQADVICADLPWGSLVGSHDENLVLYPAFFQSITRLAAPQARLILLSHEIRLIEDLFHAFRLEWQLQESLKITQSGWHPRLYVAQFRQD